MAGKSNRGRNKKGSHNNTTNSSEPVVSSDAPVKDNISASELSIVGVNGVSAMSDTTSVISEAKESANADSANQAKQGELHLFSVPVRTQGGKKLELQLNPGDSVMDVRQFLLDAPETCFFTCYDLLLHTKDGSVHHLEDYNEISELLTLLLVVALWKWLLHCMMIDLSGLMFTVQENCCLCPLFMRHYQHHFPCSMRQRKTQEIRQKLKSQSLMAWRSWMMLLLHSVIFYHLPLKISRV